MSDFMKRLSRSEITTRMLEGQELRIIAPKLKIIKTDKSQISEEERKAQNDANETIKTKNLIIQLQGDRIEKAEYAVEVWREECRKRDAEIDLLKKALEEKAKYQAFHDHIKAHFEKEHPNWKVKCKICGLTIDEILAGAKI